jgi:hypothetical protein
MKIVFMILTLHFSAWSQMQLTIAQKLAIISQAERAGGLARLPSSDLQLIHDSLDNILTVIQPTSGGSSGDVVIISDPTPPLELSQIIAYSDDYCAAPITELFSTDQCNQLSNALGDSRLWSVKINGQCIDIYDTSFRNKCPSLVALAGVPKPKRNDLELYISDDCSPITKTVTIGPLTQCQPLVSTLDSKQVWSIKWQGQCIDTSDISFNMNSCNSYVEATKAVAESRGNDDLPQNTATLFSDDYCKMKISTVNRGSPCATFDKMFNSRQVWSVLFRGQCININDTSFYNACSAYSSRK